MIKSAQHLVDAMLYEACYKLSTTQIDLPAAQRDFLIKWGRVNIKDDDLYYDDKGKLGREADSHVTVLYGLTAQTPPKELKDIVHQTKPFTLTLKGVTLFENDKFDVVKLDVESDELHSLSSAIRQQCDNENSYPKYVPHVTIAYVKKGRGADLIGEFPFKDGTEISAEFEAGELVFSGAGESDDADRIVRLPFNRTKNEGSVALRNQRLVQEGSAKRTMRQMFAARRRWLVKWQANSKVIARYLWRDLKAGSWRWVTDQREATAFKSREAAEDEVAITIERRGTDVASALSVVQRDGNSMTTVVRGEQYLEARTTSRDKPLAQEGESAKKALGAIKAQDKGFVVYHEQRPGGPRKYLVAETGKPGRNSWVDSAGLATNFKNYEWAYWYCNTHITKEEGADKCYIVAFSNAEKSARAVAENEEPTAAEITKEAEKAEPPSDGQKDSGNYKKGHITLYDLDITIENAKGSERSGKDKDGKVWSVTMPAHYGDVRGTEGKDGDAVDVYIGDEPEATDVYIVDQVDAESGKFDEHKCMLAFKDEDQAKATYVKGFSDGKGEKRIGGITTMTVDKFKEWVKSTRAKKPLSDVQESRTVAFRRVAEGEPKRTIRQVLATQAEKPITLWGPTRPGATDWSVRITDEKAAWLIRHDYAEAADVNELITDYSYEELDKIANLTEARSELRRAMAAAHAPETELKALGFVKVFAGSREGNGCAAAWEKKTALTKLEVTLSTTGEWLVHSYHWSEPRKRFEQIEWNYRWLPQSGPISTAIDRVQNAHAGFVHEPVQDLFGESVKRSIKQALAAAPYFLARRTRDGYGKPLLGGAWYWTDRGSWSTSKANALKFSSEEEALYAVEAVMGESCMEDFGVYIEEVTPVQEGESAKQALRNINAGEFVIRGRSWGAETGRYHYWHEGSKPHDDWTHWVSSLQLATRYAGIAAARQAVEREWNEAERRECGIEVVSLSDAQAADGSTVAPVSEGESVKRVRRALDAGEFVIGGYPLGHSDEMRYWREDTGGWARDMKDAERYKGRASVQQAIEAFMGSYWLKKLRIVAVPYTETVDSPKPPVAEAKQSARFRKEMPHEAWVVWRAINYNGKSVPVVYWRGEGLGWTRNRVVAKHFISKEDAQQAIPDELDRYYPGGLQTAKVYWKQGMTETSTRAATLATELLSAPALSRSLL